MSSKKVCSIYEGTALRQVTGPSIRPGGFRLTDRAIAFCNLAPGAKILDVGCGTGATVEYLIEKYHFNALGIDPSEVLLQNGRQRRPDLPLLQGVGECLPFSDGEMEGVFAECTLSLMDNLDRALGECQRVLKVGGYLMAADIYAKNPAATAELRTLPLASCLTGAMGQTELAAKLGAAGFQIILWQDHSELLKELMIQLIMTHGSMNQFWQQYGPVTGGGACVQSAIKKAKPGYYLLVAQKVDHLCD
ncbi:DVU_1556 family methyltransferase [Desulfotomaculum sp. 1211_IL3151]|uniref:DVU_1556 family methyltransferase n=1 Tax=Desulfotomaculum sp. 1211_IL3151 TaxID=3084055 RepID=UPI002FDA8A32